MNEKHRPNGRENNPRRDNGPRRADRFAERSVVDRLSANDNGNTLHGGFTGIDRLLWSVDEHTVDSITFSLLDPAGNDGWPGAGG